MAFIAANWDRIPLRYGKSLLTRTPLHVFGFLIFAEGLVALLLAMMIAVWLGSNRPVPLTPMQKAPLAVAYMLSVIFTATGVSPATQIPDWLIAAFVPLAALAVIVYVVKGQVTDEDTPDTTPNECWNLGVYYNPKDPALLVRARAGYGYTLNMANRWSYRIMGGFLGGVAVLVGFLFWSLR